MDAAFNKWFDGVIKKWEGGAALRPKSEDPGGLTNHGVTLKYWQREAHNYVNQPPTAEALLNISWDDARKIAYNGFWLKQKINSVHNSALRPVVADAYWLGGGLKSLGYSSIGALNKDLLAGPSKLYNRRMAYLKSLSNWGPNAKGWTSRVNDVYKISHKLSFKRKMIIGSMVLVGAGLTYGGYRYFRSH
jgi:lysozyme family protein